MYSKYIDNIDGNIEQALLNLATNELSINYRDEIEKNIRELKELLRDNKEYSANITLKINFLIALLYGIKNEYKIMKKYINKSLQGIKKYKSQDYGFIGRLYSQISILNIILNDLENSDIYYRRFIEVCKKYDSTSDEIIYYCQIIYIQSKDKNNINNVIRLIEEVNIKVSKLNNDKYKMIYHFIIGKSYILFLDDALMSKLNLLKALKISNKLSMNIFSFLCNFRLGICEIVSGNYEYAKRYYNEAIYNENYKNISFSYKYRALNNLAEVLIENKEYNLAKENINKAINVLNLIEDNDIRKIEEFSIFLTLSKYYLKSEEKSREKVIYYLEKTKELVKYNDIKKVYPLYKLELLYVEIEKLYIFNEYKAAINKAKELVYESLHINNHSFLQKAYKIISLCYEELKEYKLCIEYFKLYSDLKKKYIKTRDRNYLNSLDHRYEFIEKEIINIKKIETSLHKKKYIDSLTNVYNRKHLNLLCEENKIEEYETVFIIDIDYFKKYNDKYGHLKGDEILIKLAKCIYDFIYDDMSLIRYGGEEFVIISKDKDIKRLDAFGESLCKRVEEKFENMITVSVGMYTRVSHEEDIYSIINNADKGLYIAKDSGRNIYINYNNLIEGGGIKEDVF